MEMKNKAMCLLNTKSKFAARDNESIEAERDE